MRPMTRTEEVSAHCAFKNKTNVKHSSPHISVEKKLREKESIRISEPPKLLREATCYRQYH